MLENGIKVIVLWDNFADYHFARFRSAIDSCRDKNMELIAAEFVQTNASHQWFDGKKEMPVFTLAEESPKTVWDHFHFGIRFIRLLSDYQPDLIFLPSYWPSRPLIALILTSIIGTKAIMMNESHAKSARATGFQAYIKGILVRLFYGGFVAGHPQVRYFSKMGLKQNRIQIGYSSIDGQALAKRCSDANYLAQMNEKFRVPRSRFLSLGRLIAKKNLKLLISAYRQLLDESSEPAPALVIVGVGGEREELERFARSLTFPVRIFEPGCDFLSEVRSICFYPFCKNFETAYFYRGSVAFILASRSEEWGLVINEATACGVPVIVSNMVGSSEDLVQEGVNGFVFEDNDVVKLKLLMKQLWSDTKLQSKMSANASAMIDAVSINRFGVGFLASVLGSEVFYRII